MIATHFRPVVRDPLPKKEPGQPRYQRVKALGRRESRHRWVFACGCWVEFSGFESPTAFVLPDGLSMWDMSDKLRWKWQREYACCADHGGPGETADRDWGLEN